MPRIYNEIVFDDVIEGTATVITPAEFNEILGRADHIRVQLRVTQVSGTSPTITVTLCDSNDNRLFLSCVSLWSATALTPGSSYNDLEDTGTAILGNFDRLEITLGGTSPSARVTLIACGRTS